MTPTRLEAFSDGVIAIIITIMVLELHAPEAATLDALRPLLPVLLSYVLSFLLVAIMWVNHHHLIHSVRAVDRALLWRNVNLLFWMSLIPFVTALLGRAHGAPVAVSAYALVLAASAGSFWLLRDAVARAHRGDAALEAWHRKQQRRSVVTVATYLASAGLAFVSVWIAYAAFVVLPALYFLPERAPEG